MNRTTESFSLQRPMLMLLALLRSALNGETANESQFVEATETDWKECYLLAVKQGVMALSWDGLQTLPATLQPGKALKLKWALAVENYEKRYAYYVRIVHELSEMFSGHGIGLMQLKGVGFSSCYPVPSHREGGDIDIYLYSLDPERMTHDEARERGEKLIESLGIVIDRKHSKKHYQFYYKGISVESHRTFLNVYTTAEAAVAEAHLNQCLQPTSVALLDGQVHVLVPPLAFNAVFIPFHAAQHFVNGLALHHLCDWACLLQKGAYQLLPPLPPKVRRFIDTLTAICHEHLGTLPPDSADPEFSAYVLQCIQHPMNFREGIQSLEGKPVQIFFYRFRRIFRMHRQNNMIFKSSLAGRLLKAFKNNVWRPARLFRIPKL